jgi:hypothetical protein
MQLLKPSFAGNGIGIERGNPGRLAVGRGEIIGGGEAEVGMGEV